MNDFNTKIHDYIESHESEIINTLASLIEIPSVKGETKENMPFGEYPYMALAKMLEICKSNGFDTKNVDNYVGQADFYKGIEPELGILCHLDVVPAGDGWTSNPFKMELKDGMLIGRGVADDKGPAVIVLYAMKALKDLGYNLKKNVRFIFGTDEEKGSSDIRYYEKKEQLPKLVFTADAEYPLINLEKGMVRGEVSFKENNIGGKKSILKANGGFVTNAVPARANATLSGFNKEDVDNAFSASSLSNISYTFVDNVLYVEGKSAHASTPSEGVNAVTALCKILSNLCTSDSTNEIFKHASSLFVFGETNGKTLGINFKDEKSGELTFVLSIMNYDHGNFSANFDIRFPICTNVNEVRFTLEKSISKEGFVLSSLSGVEPHYVDEDSDFVKTLLSVYEQHTNLKGEAIAIGGGTYVHEIENGVAFGCAFPGEDNHMHGADECVSLENVKKNIAIFASAIYELCK